MDINVNSNRRRAGMTFKHAPLSHILSNEEKLGPKRATTASSFSSIPGATKHSSSSSSFAKHGIRDLRRKFVEAAAPFHELCWVAGLDEEGTHTLCIFVASSLWIVSLLCSSGLRTSHAFLAPAGSNRPRALASLHRDERLCSFHIITSSLRACIVDSASNKLSSAFSAESMDDSTIEDRFRSSNSGVHELDLPLCWIAQ
ncbi:hypothetical protein BS47DRAFT_1395631 [Hydnum rufescens UP504]|uniref:Uncharacterized protein n=1 Tax=Hydnum rufescens UP504 TaxID=1448309 RepID=A0A9P6DQ88_9AGAM|nr:hypothetical protein BS47DRAFT_1395631 [Hydnum rufescens UP504]